MDLSNFVYGLFSSSLPSFIPFFLPPFLSAIIGVSVWSKGTQGVRLTGSIPPYSERAWMFGAHLLVNEILFFYAHWAMHKGSLYKMFHKKHHEFTAPFALAALYCHPVEFIVAGKNGKGAQWIPASTLYLGCHCYCASVTQPLRLLFCFSLYVVLSPGRPGREERLPSPHIYRVYSIGAAY